MVFYVDIVDNSINLCLKKDSVRCVCVCASLVFGAMIDERLKDSKIVLKMSITSDHNEIDKSTH